MATIQDVATMAGVSTATVSRVLSGYAHVSPSVRDRVTGAVEKLGYEPNYAAKSLRTLKTSRLIVTVPDITNIFFANIIRGAEEAAHAAGYAVLLGDTGTNTDSEEAYAGMLKRREADGLIFLGEALPQALAGLVERPGAPIVNGCEFSEDLTVSSVHIDNRAAAAEAMDHLYGLGHRRVAVITGAVDRPISRQRLEGVYACAERHGAEVQVFTGDFSVESGVAATVKALKGARPTAFFCFSDEMAIGALSALRQAGLRCPEDVSVVGFDDIHMAPYTWPALTTVRQPMHEIGQQTVELLIDIIEGRVTERVNLTLPHQLVVRDSTAAPRG